MTIEKVDEIRKEITFANMVLNIIAHVNVPMLMFEEEKNVVKKALIKYKDELESELRGR